MRWTSLRRARYLGARPRGWWTLVASGTVVGLSVPILVLLLGLLTELLTTKGILQVPRVPGHHLEDIRKWAGHSKIYELETGEYVHFDNSGLMPLVYRHRDDRLLGPVLKWAYSRWSVLGKDAYCLRWLTLIGLATATVMSAAMVLAQRSGRRAALDVAASLETAIHAQAFRHGADGLLGRGLSRPERLIDKRVRQIQTGFVAWYRAVPRAVVSSATLVLLALAVNFWLTVAAIALASLAWVIYRWLSGRARERVRDWDDRAAQQHAKIVEQIRQAPLAIGYSLTEPFGEPLGEVLRRYRSAAFQSAVSDTVVGPILNLFVLAAVSFLLFLIGLNVLFDERAQMSLTETVVLGTALTAAFFPGRRLFLLSGTLSNAERAADDVFAYLDREPVFEQADSAVEMKTVREGFQIESVTLADDRGRRLLDNVSMTIPARQRIALVASDPEMGRALAGLLVRMHDPAAGRVLCDGCDLRELTLSSLRRQTAALAGDGMVFTGSVSENIGCGDTGTVELQLIDAAKKARAYEFITQLPQGFATIIGRHAMQLDGGQAFRIGLARLAVREPSVLIIQEPEKKIDDESGSQIDEAIKDLSAGRSLIILPTRISTLRSADRVYLLHEAKLVAQGTHAELVQENELYRHLTYIRYNEFRDRVR